MVDKVDIVYGAAYGDCGKGKITHALAERKNENGTNYYSYVCRWNGGSNAGHTIYHNGVKYATHIIPCGIFHGIPSVIGPGCVLNINSFYEELKVLEMAGFNTSLIKIHPGCHIVLPMHLKEDQERYVSSQGSTAQGIAPCYRDKYARVGVSAKHIAPNILLNEPLSGNILCEGAQGFHLDINHGNYPYVTSSETLPYAACSLGFSPKKINNIYACAKIYDTRVGVDPLFPESLLEDPVLSKIGEVGKEFGTTTGRRRKVNWLNLNKLIEAINVGGATHLVINKCDVLEEVGVFKVLWNGDEFEFNSIKVLKQAIREKLNAECPDLKYTYFSSNPKIIEGFQYD